MKKIILFIMLSMSSFSMTSQVKNLNDFLDISMLETIEMPNYMSPAWEVLRPYEEISRKHSNTGNLVTGFYIFKTSGQTIERKVMMDMDSGRKKEGTSLTVKNDILIQKIIKGFGEYGIKLKGKVSDGTLYGNSSCIIKVERNQKTGVSKISLMSI